MQIQEMQIEVNRFLESLNVDTRGIIVANCRDDIAKAIGLYINGTIPILNLKVNAAFGNVLVNKDYLNRTLTYDEQRFVLAHETSHIYLNHVVPRAIDRFIAELIRNYDRDVHAFINTAKVFLYLLNIPLPLSAIVKEQEIAADVRAISLTGNENAAISCLTKLVDGNLDAYSHTWEALGVKMPVMTMRERIQEIQRRLYSLNQYGRPNHLHV
jgi:Zn-dependent protease with chaperone function